MKRNIENSGASGPRQKRAVDTASSCTGSSGIQEEQEKPRVVERPKPKPLPHMKEWLSVEHFKQRVAAVTAPPDCNLPAGTNQMPWLFLALPSELLNKIASARDAKALALTCRQACRHFNQSFPLMRLEALAKLLFPADSNRFPSGTMVEHMQRLLQGGLDQTLYMPMAASLRAALTLAFLAAIPLSNDPDPTTLTMLTTVRERVSALGDAALVAASDLIDEYIRQSDAVSEATLNHVASSSRSGVQARILPALLPLLQNAPQELAQKLLWDVARFYVRFPHFGFAEAALLMQLFKSRTQVFSPEVSLLLNAATQFNGASLPGANAHGRVQAAQHCLAEFIQIALAANGQLRRIGSVASPGKAWKDYVSRRARGACGIATMIRRLELSPEDEQALIPQHLRLLEIQLDNLAMLNPLSPIAKRQKRYLKLTDWLNGDLQNGPEEPLAQDIAGRIGELTRLAIKLRGTQPGLIAQLEKLIRLWPDERSRDLALEWFQGKASA